MTIRVQDLEDEDSVALLDHAAKIAGLLAHRHGNEDTAKAYERIAGALRVQETAARLKVLS